jgi:hypothetical protein
LLGTAGTVSFTYDPFGRRIRRVAPSGTTIFLYDGANVVDEVNGARTVNRRVRARRWN